MVSKSAFAGQDTRNRRLGRESVLNCLRMRLFVGIPLAEAVIAEQAAVAAQLRRREDGLAPKEGTLAGMAAMIERGGSRGRGVPVHAICRVFHNIRPVVES